MGGSPSKILHDPPLWLGGSDGAQDASFFRDNSIRVVVSVCDQRPGPQLIDECNLLVYHILAADDFEEDLRREFSESAAFIHAARTAGSHLIRAAAKAKDAGGTGSRGRLVAFRGSPKRTVSAAETELTAGEPDAIRDRYSWLNHDETGTHAPDTSDDSNAYAVYVHCQEGVSRSATITISYLMQFLNMTFRDALSHSKRVRKQVHPNEAFVEQLEKLEMQMKTDCWDESLKLNLKAMPFFPNTKSLRRQMLADFDFMSLTLRDKYLGQFASKVASKSNFVFVHDGVGVSADDEPLIVEWCVRPSVLQNSVDQSVPAENADAVRYFAANPLSHLKSAAEISQFIGYPRDGLIFCVRRVDALAFPDLVLDPNFAAFVKSGAQGYPTLKKIENHDFVYLHDGWGVATGAEVFPVNMMEPFSRSELEFLSSGALKSNTVPKSNTIPYYAAIADPYTGVRLACARAFISTHNSAADRGADSALVYWAGTDAAITRERLKQRVSSVIQEEGENLDDFDLENDLPAGIYWLWG